MRCPRGDAVRTVEASRFDPPTCSEHCRLTVGDDSVGFCHEPGGSISREGPNRSDSYGSCRFLALATPPTDSVATMARQVASFSDLGPEDEVHVHYFCGSCFSWSRHHLV